MRKVPTLALANMSIARAWTFTINNFDDHDETKLDAVCSRLSTQEVRYAIIGKEKGESGTPHLQGYVSFTKTKRFNAVKKLVGTQAHIEPAKGNEQHNYDYCSKEGDFIEIGRRSTTGKRSDLEDFKEAVKQGNRNPKRLREEFSEVCAKYPRFVAEYIRDNVEEPKLEMHPLRDWQQDLYRYLSHEPDDRQVVFVVDYQGNKGKSWFAKYYCHIHDNAFLMRPGKHADMAYMIPPELRVLFLDCTRKQVEYMPYTFMEELKDGYVGSTKYESCVKKYQKMHVVVLMNQDPDLTALSEDRYHIIKLE